MVDLTLFHQTPGVNYKPKDRLNRCTGALACYFLEWSGWYNQALSLRLLGHYRLFQLYRKDPDNNVLYKEMPIEQSYVLQYRSGHPVKYAFSRIMAFIFRIVTLGRAYPAVEVEAFNGTLIHQHAEILQTFLRDAELDFTKAFRHAMASIHTLNNNKGGDVRPLLLVQVNNEYHTNREYKIYQRNETYHNQYVQAGVGPKEAVKGKEKDVFSKKQVLILFDLLSQAAKMEKIDFGKPNKFDGIAAFFHAATGKSKQSWLDELGKYKTIGLYAFHTQGELNQLISTIVNLTEFLRRAGYYSLVRLAEQKLRELERHKKE